MIECNNFIQNRWVRSEFFKDFYDFLTENSKHHHFLIVLDENTFLRTGHAIFCVFIFDSFFMQSFLACFRLLNQLRIQFLKRCIYLAQARCKRHSKKYSLIKGSL